MAAPASIAIVRRKPFEMAARKPLERWAGSARNLDFAAPSRDDEQSAPLPFRMGLRSTATPKLDAFLPPLRGQALLTCLCDSLHG